MAQEPDDASSSAWSHQRRPRLPGVRFFVRCTCLSLLITATAAQTYPVKPIRMLVGFAPGGTADIMARALSPRLADQWRQPIVIDNRAPAPAASSRRTLRSAAGRLHRRDDFE